MERGSAVVICQCDGWTGSRGRVLPMGARRGAHRDRFAHRGIDAADDHSVLVADRRRAAFDAVDPGRRRCGGRGDRLNFRAIEMSKKSGKIAAMIESFRGQVRDAHYLGYFACFNEGLYYEAHDVLEEMWLPNRGQPSDHF